MKVPDCGDLHKVMFDSSSGIVGLSGFEDYKKNNWFCLEANGTRYHEYGISTGSILLCSTDVPANQGDLVVVGEDAACALYVYDPELNLPPKRTIRVTAKVSDIRAVVLSSFNFFK